MVAEWARDLYATAPMPDKRLNPRLVNMAAHLAQKPTDPITRAFDAPADVKAAYRCIENDRVRPIHLRRAFSQKTVRDAAGHSVALSIQDSVTLSFPRAPATEGLGLISETDVRGLIAHSTLLATLEGMPIGVIAQDAWSREGKREGTREQRQRLPIEEKESYKWIRAMRETRRSFAEQLPPQEIPRLIHIFDREGDVHEVFEEALRHGEGCVIRSTQDRRARTEDGRVVGAHALVASAPLLGVTEVEIMRRGDRPARTARVEIRAIALVLEPASPHHPDRDPLALTMVEAREVNAAADVKEPILWRLWNTEPAGTFEEALIVVKYYSHRWLIEEVHLILKSGCRIEDVRFHTAERIEKALAIYTPVAVLILQLREWSRLEPEAPCTRILDETTWRVLYGAVHRRLAPAGMPPPTMREAVLWIGRLGATWGAKGTACQACACCGAAGGTCARSRPSRELLASPSVRSRLPISLFPLFPTMFPTAIGADSVRRASKSLRTRKSIDITNSPRHHCG